MGQVGVERAHRHQDRIWILSFLAEEVVAVTDVPQALLPGACRGDAQMQRLDARLVQFKITPEQQDQF